mmetsp:Transcript_523/g.1302  ORF Transcript_523/g.1302 Transcript_523/m.1302 type:complete len:504 (-) Transcript_523:1693-3204(-)
MKRARVEAGDDQDAPRASSGGPDTLCSPRMLSPGEILKSGKARKLENGEGDEVLEAPSSRRMSVVSEATSGSLDASQERPMSAGSRKSSFDDFRKRVPALMIHNRNPSVDDMGLSPLQGNISVLSQDAQEGRNAELLQALEVVRKATSEVDHNFREDEERRRLIKELAYEVDRLHYEMNLPRSTPLMVNPPMGETVIARTWPELLRSLDLNSWDSWRGSFQSPFVFRGLPNRAFRLMTSLQRLGHGIGSLAERDMEKAIIRSFRNYSHGALPPGSPLFEWLTLAQHHGCPTRMLDFSYSPLVALHFATSDPIYDDEDGVVWCVQPRKCLAASKTYKELYTEWKKSAHDSYWSVARIDQVHSLLAFAYKLQGKDSDVPGFEGDNIGSSMKTLDRLEVLGDSLVFMEAPALHQRVINQNHVFAFLSDSTKTTDQWLEQHQSECTHRKIVISKHLKQEVRQRLNNFAITERLLFPGLDGTSRWLKKFYTASTAAAPSTPNLSGGPL